MEQGCNTVKFWSEMKLAVKVAVCASMILGIPTVLMLSCFDNIFAKEVMPPPVETPATTAREEIVTGMCTFGDCPVVPNTHTTACTTEATVYDLGKVEEVVVTENATTEELSEVVEESSSTAYKPEAVEPVTERHDYGYLGTFYITGYTAEEGFSEGSATASGYGVRSGYCAMNDSQRRSLGISYGDQIYVAGLGTYTVMDCGCGWGTVDIWFYTNAEAYSITGYREVYIA